VNTRHAQILADLRRGIREKHPHADERVIDALFAEAVGELHDPDFDREAGIALSKSLHRRELAKRTKGIRDAVPVTRGQVQLTLPFMELTILEAEDVVRREKEHAKASEDRARYDDFIVSLARERCQDRGLDPDATTFTIGSLITPEEIEALWRDRCASAPPIGEDAE
jgi:hypothetical protein